MITDRIDGHFEVRWDPRSRSPVRFIYKQLGRRDFTRGEFQRYVGSLPHELEMDMMRIQIGRAIMCLSQKQYGFFRRVLLDILQHI